MPCAAAAVAGRPGPRRTRRRNRPRRRTRNRSQHSSPRLAPLAHRPPPRVRVSTPRSGKFGSLSSRAISRRPIGSRPVGQARGLRLVLPLEGPHGHRRHPRYRLGGGVDRAEVHGLGEAEVVRREQPGASRDEHRRADLRAQVVRLARRRTGRPPAARTAAGRRRGRSRPGGTARARSGRRRRSRPAAVSVPAGSTVRNTVCQLPVHRQVAAARWTAGSRVGDLAPSRPRSPRAAAP